MTVDEMNDICEEAGVLPEDRKYLQSTGLPVDDLGIPEELQQEIVKGVEEGRLDGFRFAGGTMITFLGGVQLKDKILKYNDPLFPGFGRLSTLDE